MSKKIAKRAADLIGLAAPTALPEGWKVVQLGDVSEKPQYGYTAPAIQKPVGPKMLRITDIQEGRVNWSTVPYCECSQEDLEKYALHPGDIVFARTGSVGKAFLITQLPEKAAFASYLIRVRVSQDIDTAYCYFFMQSPSYWQQITSRTHGAVQPNVNATQLRSLLLPLPPLPEQRAIARVLSTLQRAIEAQDKLIGAARELKRALMRHLFTYGAVPPAEAERVPLKETEVGMVPEEWGITKLDDLLESRLGKMLSGVSRKGISPRPYLRNANVQWGRVDLSSLAEMDFTEEERETFRLREGDILVCEGGEVGRTAIWRGELPECYFQKAIHRLRPRNSRINREFFMYHMMNAFLIRETYGIVGTTTTIATCLESNSRR